MSKRSMRNVERLKKRTRRRIARPKQTRIQGNTIAVRTRLKKEAGKARSAATGTAD